MKKQSLLASSTVMVLAQVWGMLLTLCITPYIYHSLGSAGYGLFCLVLVLANYLTVVDLGFGWGIIKFVAQYAAGRDFAKMEGVIRVSIWMSLALGVIMAIAVAFLAPWLVHSVFNVPASQTRAVTAGVVLAGGACILLLQSNVLAGVLKGLQRFDIAVGLRSISLTVRMLGYLLLLAAGYGLFSLWLLTVLSILACTLAYGWSIKRLIPSVRLFPRFDRSSFKEIFSFSALAFGTRLFTMPYFYLDKLFIGALLPAAALSYYVIPFNLAQKIGGVGGLVVSVLVPSASVRSQDRDQLRKFYRRVVPVTYSVILPVTVVAVTIGPQFLGYWIDTEFASLASLPLTLVAVGFGAIALGSVDGTFVESVGRPRIRTTIYCCLAVVALPLCYVLTSRFGINGTAVTVCLAFCAGGFLEVLLHHALITKSWWYFRRILPSACALTALGLAAGWGARALASGLWSSIGVAAGLCLLLTVAGMRIFHTREQFNSHLARVATPAYRFIKTVRTLALAPFGR